MKLINLLLCTFVLAMSIFSTPSTTVEAKVGGNVRVSQLPTAGPNITWTLNNGTLTISGSGEMSEYYSPQHYPWYDKRASINRVVINAGITNIPTYIFGNEAYPNLTSVSIPGTVKKIGSFAFHASGLREVVIPNGVETLDESVFINCPNLTKVTIAPSVKAIGISAFENCNQLREVHIQDLRTWVNIKFGSFYANPLEKGKKLYLNGNLVTRLDIPAGVTKIADFAFVNCDSIQVVNMPASVTEIGNHSFQNAASLHTVNAGGVTSVGSYGFGGSGQLRNVTLSPNLSYIGEYGFAYTPISSITIKRGIIDDYAFIGCGLLTTVNMGAGVNYIGQSAFENCAALLPPHGKSVYTGTQAQFNAIPKETGNDILNRAAFTYTGREAAATPYKAKETIKLGSYYQSNSTTKEPIEWIVLKREGRYALVVSKYILYVDRFNNSYDLYNYPTTTDWANTTMREKLNTTFYNEAFSAEDKKKIAQRSISISNNLVFGTAGGSASNDHVFLLSEEEVKNYFANDMERKAEATQYAIKKARSEYGEGPNEKGGSYYWLRNSGLTKMNKQYVHNSGMVDEIGMATTNTITGVRPALWIELYSAETVSKVEEFVTRLYQLCLNRNPDANGKAYWVNSLLNKEITAAGAAKGFFESNEMKKLNLSNEEFVKRCYRVMMNREADNSGKAYWVDRLSIGMSRLSVVKGFVASNEFTRISNSYGIEKGDINLTENRDLNYGVTAFVSRCYTKVLGRGFDVNGLNYWTGKIMESANKKEAAANAASSGFFNSNEFVNKRLSNADFIRVCYRTFLDREADSNGLNYWLTQMPKGKEVILRGFANSNEFNAIMAKYGIR